MQHPNQLIVWGAMLGISALAGLSASLNASAADGIKAAYVEAVIPSKTYSGHILLSSYSAYGTATAGPSQAGVLGIGTVTISNFDSVLHSVYIGTPILSAACGASAVTYGWVGDPLLVLVQANSTLVLPFPTPYVVNPAGGQACVGIGTTPGQLITDLEVWVTGLVN